MTEIKWSAREYLITIFSLFIVLSILLWQIPNRSWLGVHLIKPSVAKVLRAYMIPLGLNQEWKMFAPNPANVITYTELHLNFSDGEGEVILPEDRPSWVRPSVEGRPQRLILKPDYNGNGYRATAFSKLDWNFGNGILPNFRDQYLRYFCTHPFLTDGRLPERIEFLAGKITVPLLSEARAGAPDPRTLTPSLTPETSVECQ